MSTNGNIAVLRKLSKAKPHQPAAQDIVDVLEKKLASSAKEAARAEDAMVSQVAKQLDAMKGIYRSSEERIQKLLSAALEDVANRRVSGADPSASVKALMAELQEQQDDTRKKLVDSINKTLASVKTVERERRPWTATVMTRDDTGRAKTLKLTPA